MKTLIIIICLLSASTTYGGITGQPIFNDTVYFEKGEMIFTQDSVYFHQRIPFKKTHVIHKFGNTYEEKSNDGGRNKNFLYAIILSFLLMVLAIIIVKWV